MADSVLPTASKKRTHRKDLLQILSTDRKTIAPTFSHNALKNESAFSVPFIPDKEGGFLWDQSRF